MDQAQTAGRAFTALAVSARSMWVQMFMLLRQGFGAQVVSRMSRFDGLTALSEVEGLWRMSFWAVAGETPLRARRAAKVCRRQWMTVVPTSLGMWTVWTPFALPQVWPFCWWVAIVIDYFSRGAMGVTVFRKQPTAIQVRAFLGRLYAKAKPKYIISDKGPQFWCQGLKAWCKRKGIRPGFGAVGNYGSIAAVERFTRTLKDECTRRIAIPLRRRDMRREPACHLDWHNEYRPHDFLGGKTPNEVYQDRPAANEAPRIEARPHWPPGVSCAAPAAAIDGKPGRKVALVLSYHAGGKHLPVIQLKRVA